MNTENRSEESRGDIICLSHLTWETTLFQRPQQIMLRLSQMNFRVYYISQRSFLKHLISYFKKSPPREGTVLENLMFWNRQGFIGPGDSPKEKEMKLQALLMFIRSTIRKEKIENPWLWLYYPEHHPLAEHIPYSRLIYDCMDPFEHFKNGNDAIRANEKRLLKNADIVFTGGESLQKLREGVNPQTHCFPSGIDLRHFNKTLLEETQIPEELKDLPKPIYGYFGAIDERIDWNVIEKICDSNRGGSVVFLGPVLGLKRIPVKAENFHHLGAKPYGSLPNYLKGFDVCLLPFVKNALTDNMSPTKTPEYLAGGKPVVSTPIPDVVSQYGDIIEIAESPDQFADACLKVSQTPIRDTAIISDRVRKSSWDDIALEMVRKIESL